MGGKCTCKKVGGSEKKQNIRAKVLPNKVRTKRQKEQEKAKKKKAEAQAAQTITGKASQNL